MTSALTCRTIALAVVAIAIFVVPTSLAAPAVAPSLRIAPTTIDFGTGDVVLTGVAPSKRAGETITILSQACLFTEPSAIDTVTTGVGGMYRYRILPMLTTSFRVRSTGGTSAAVKVNVRPLVELRRLAAGRYRVQVSTTNPVFLDGRPVVLQRAVGAKWATVKRAVLAKASPETAITVLSAVTIKARTTGKLRALLPNAPGSCYLAGTSSTIGA